MIDLEKDGIHFLEESRSDRAAKTDLGSDRFFENNQAKALLGFADKFIDFEKKK